MLHDLRRLCPSSGVRRALPPQADPREENTARVPRAFCWQRAFARCALRREPVLTSAGEVRVAAHGAARPTNSPSCPDASIAYPSHGVRARFVQSLCSAGELSLRSAGPSTPEGTTVAQAEFFFLAQEAASVGCFCNQRRRSRCSQASPLKGTRPPGGTTTLSDQWGLALALKRNPLCARRVVRVAQERAQRAYLRLRHGGSLCRRF
jgi:hypothetical protein